MIATLGNPHVHIVGHVSDEELVAFYEVADLFLCASEHEGFCVPIVEAFYKQVPVARLRRHGRSINHGRCRRDV